MAAYRRGKDGRASGRAWSPGAGLRGSRVPFGAVTAAELSVHEVGAFIATLPGGMLVICGVAVLFKVC